MSATLRDMLNERADDVEIPDFDVSRLVTQGQARERRRGRLVAGAASVAVIALLAGTAFALRPNSDPPPATNNPPDRDDRGVVSLDSSRPLGYADAQTIHFGDKAIDTGMTALSVDVTDDGVLFTTIDGLIWFSDGTTFDKIGDTLGGRVNRSGTEISWPAGRPEEWVSTDNAGSRAVWWEYPDKGQREMVVYDTSNRSVVGRAAVEPVCSFCRVRSIGDSTVYLANTGGVGQPVTSRVFGYDISTGERTTLSPAAYQSEIRGSARALVTGESFADGVITDGIGQDFTVHGSNLVADNESGNGAASALFVAGTGQRVRLEAPAALANGSELTVFQWLDDDRIALKDWPGGRGRQYVVCRLSTGRCHLMSATASAYVLVAEVPGVAHEYALTDAAAAARDER